MLYAIGDIHGRFDLLQSLHEKIMEHSKQYDEIHTVIFLGDYIDRGPQSKEVIEFLQSEPFEGFKHVFLKGNHEDMLTKALYARSDRVVLEETVVYIDYARQIFLRNGGAETLASFGFTDTDVLIYNPQLFTPAFEGCREWLSQLKPYYVDNGYLFVHAGIIPGLPIEEQNLDVLMWIRNRFLNSTKNHEYMVIHGHTKRNDGKPDIQPNRINVDTAAWQTGVLTAVCLDEAKEIQPQFLSTEPLTTVS